ncbi:MAG: hypothetical protein DLM72_03810 [Candidatus Nitrosopolaris wilkensis]|nr:MAG: hypothetical protein DLM72_03810 [Candidatus Nitrosopolaris wilkensis]
MSSKDDPKSVISHHFNEFEDKTYEDLSQEFEGVYSAAANAFELVPQMYNRLTLVDGLTHKEALVKIHNDHRNLAGFTQRNIRRYLPGDNHQIRKRIRTSRPKNSSTEAAEHLELSNIVQVKEDIVYFEFSLGCESLSNYMNELYKSDNTFEVWFSGELDKSTGKVVAAYTGRKGEGS